MKTLLLIAAMALVGCASSSKKEMNEESMKVKVEETTKEVEMKAKSKMKKMKDSAQALTCNSGSDKRMIEVKSEDGGCEVLYTKNGETSSIASAKYDLGYCSKIQDRIVTNLTNAGFKCE